MGIVVCSSESIAFRGYEHIDRDGHMRKRDGFFLGSFARGESKQDSKKEKRLRHQAKEKKIRKKRASI